MATEPGLHDAGTGVPGYYITDDLRQRADDVVWRVRGDGEWIYLYLLIEFQSKIDAYMALRIMV